MPEEDDQRWFFKKVGLGYEVHAPKAKTTIRVTRIKRSSGELHGQIRVTANLAGVKTHDGVLHLARFNLSSSASRTSLAKMLGGRTPGHDMDWFDGLEALCQGIHVAEEAGQPYVTLGLTAMARSATSYAIDPVVPANVAALLYGPGGSGKSILALAGAMSVQDGREIIPGVAPGIKGNVLYLDWETDAPVLNERIIAIANGAGYTPSGITYRRCIRPLSDEAEEIAAVVAERDIVYMVVDSAGMAMGTGGEYGDSNESTLRLFDAIRHIGVSTQIVDHVSKQEMRNGKGKSVGLLPYGSIYKVNLARSAWEIRNETTDQDESSRISLVHTKANDSRLKPQLNIEIIWETGVIRFGTWEETLEAYIPQDGGKRRDQIMAYLRHIHPAHAHGPQIATICRIPVSSVMSEVTRRSKGSFAHYPDGYGLSDIELGVIPIRRDPGMFPDEDE